MNPELPAKTTSTSGEGVELSPPISFPASTLQSQSGHSSAGNSYSRFEFWSPIQRAARLTAKLLNKSLLGFDLGVFWLFFPILEMTVNAVIYFELHAARLYSDHTL